MARSKQYLRPDKLGRFARRLYASRSGVAMVEFAFAAPLVLGMGMLGTDTAALVITHMQVSQIATQVADNASRVGIANASAIYEVTEGDINDTFIGAERVGESINIFQQGRIIISSLQRNSAGGQWIAWQRCRGAKNHPSSYGVQGDGATGTAFEGMGEAGRRITATQGEAVIFVEVAYDFTPITPITVFDNTEITYTAAFNVRDRRNLTGGSGNNGIFPGNPVQPVAQCSTFSANRPT